MLTVFERYDRYDRLISDIKIKDVKIKTNSIFHFDFYMKMMHEAEIDITKCYDDRLFFDCKQSPNISQDLDISVEKISIKYNGLNGFYISFNLEISDSKKVYIYNACEKHMEMFLFNTINNGAIIY